MRRAVDDDLDVLLDLEARRYRQSATRRYAKKWLESGRRWPSPDLALGAEVYLMQCRLRASLRHIVGKRQPPRTVGLQLGSGDRASVVKAAIELWTRAGLVACATVEAPPAQHSPKGGLASDDPHDAADAVRALLRAVSSQLVLVIVGADGAVPKRLAAHIDLTVSLASPTHRHMRALLHRAAGQDVEASDALITALCAVPVKDLDLVVRPGRPIRNIARHVERLASVPIDADDVGAPLDTSVQVDAAGRRPTFHQTARLEDLAGMDEAVVWGQELVRDLVDWRAGTISWAEVDPGVLLAGPPGTGKTLFAQALATSCGVHFETASRATWQSAGYLHSMLKSMRASFANAAAKAPAILFIDEIDSIGDRGSFRGHNASYDGEVVAALLQCLDSIDRREGVVVVAATNDPTRIDPALLRSGRLDRVIHLQPPDADARAKIMRTHLDLDPRGHALDETAIHDIVDRLHGFTGADLERLVRLARRRARAGRREITVADLHAVRPEVCIPTAEDIRRVAVHEAGHALILHRHGIHVLSITINALVAPDGRWQAGLTTQEVLPAVLETEQALAISLAVALAGHAAEEVVLGGRSNGAGGGGPDSDLARATDIALRMEAQLGLGQGLAQIVGIDDLQPLDRLRYPIILARVEARLAAVYADVLSAIKENRRTVEVLAERLIEVRSLDEAEIRRFLQT